jgi:hypothetical protein
MSDPMVPPPPPPPPSTPGGGGFDANAAVDQFKGADPLDLAVVGAGVLAFLLSLFHGFYTAKVDFGGYVSGTAGSTSAWHGFFGWAGVLLLLAAGVVVALRIVKIAVPQEEIIVAAAAVLGFLFVLLALFVDPVNTFGVVKIGHGWSYWIILILALASGGISGLKFARARGLVK